MTSSAPKDRREASQARRQPIAIVGMSCRFPGSVGPEAFYRSLLEGRDLFSEPPRDRWSWNPDDRITTSRMGLLADIFDFDNTLFRLSRREAETIDPHQRLMLEETWLAIENAGYTLETFNRRTTGVFVAMYNQDYHFYARAGDWDDISRMYLATGSAHSIIPNRVSFAFDFRGPSEVVDTACSSALVAVHRAIEAIRAGECEQAVVGGTSLLLEPSRMVMLQELGLLSPIGACAPFDGASQGQVLGEGVAALVLKPLEDAVRDRDEVLCVVLGSGVNHQGASSGGLTRPSATAQAELIRRTYQRHGIDPHSVAYVEAHGNGGSGDLSELLAFQDVLRPGLAVGSVKGNIGFLEAAGGLSQVVKVTMAIKHGVMPGTRAHRALIEDEGLRPDGCRILVGNTPIGALLPGGCQEFVAGVHAYGLGGCNAHLALAALPAKSTAKDDVVPVLLSADAAADLVSAAARLSAWLSGDDETAIADIAFTLAVGRAHRPIRAALLVNSSKELAVALDALIARGGSGESHLNEDAPRGLRDAISRWLAGEVLDWEDLLPDGRRVGLPGTPLRRSRFPLPAIAV